MIQEWFLYYNKKYFHGILDDIKVIVCKTESDGERAGGCFLIDKKEIHIDEVAWMDFLNYKARDKKYKKHKKELRKLLIHEMVHAYLSVLNIKSHIFEQHPTEFNKKLNSILKKENIL